MMRGELVTCSTPGCDSYIVTAPDRGPNPKTWQCPGCEYDVMDAYLNRRERAEAGITETTTATDPNSGDF